MEAIGSQLRLNLLHRLLFKIAFSAVLLLLMSASANAQNYNLSLIDFEPAMDSRGMITIERGQSLETGQFNLGIYLGHGLGSLNQSIGGRDATLARHYSTGHALFAVGIEGWAELGVQVPIHMVRGDFDGSGDEITVASDGIGDVRTSLKVTILRPERYPVSLALALHARLPTGSKDVFMTDDGLALTPQLIVDTDFLGRISTSLNLGYTSRSDYVLNRPTNAGGAVLDRTSSVARSNHLNADLGLVLAVVRNRFYIVVESINRLPVSTQNGEALSSAVLLGAKFFLLQHSFFSFGLTRAVVTEPTRPDWQGFVGIVFEPQEDDQDGDGIIDDKDQCLADPEDRDGFEDTDGCPEQDNDKDGLYDFVDACPNHPEDFNNFEDRDGCFDGNRDRDRDGLVDRKDQCPEQPEDRDQYRDNDGCPDPDNDMDTIPDVADKCPLIQEDIDGFEDADGCPDTDNDKDGIVDSQDRCPDQPENMDGIEDEDGCPEERVVVTREKIEFEGKVYFETDRAEIKPESTELLDAIGVAMNDHPELLKVEIQGHSDARGDDAYNLDLSARRAAAVRSYLVGKGVAPDRVVSKGYGESRPVVDEDNESAWSQNRRVEFIIIERAGMAIDGVK
jgi:outer membrane protein OmpA-like peptidoglycan-associated protein